MTTNTKLTDFWINILLLALAIFFTNLWLKHHLSDNSILITIANSLIAIYGIVFSLIGKTIGEEGEGQVGSWVKRFFWILLKPGFLVAFYLVMFIGGSIYSSVWLVNNGDKDSLQLNLYPLDASDTNENKTSYSAINGITKKGFFTSPFGRVMVLKVKGYRDYTFELFPFLGKKIMMEDVLIPMPTIWIRSYPTIINMFLDDCQLAILSHDSSDTLFLQSTKNTVGSYIIGEPQSVNSSQLDTWQREASAYYQNEGPELSKTLLKWSNSEYFNKKLNLQINKEYKVLLIYNSNHTVLGEANFIVNKKDLLVDVLLKQPKTP